jgi:hypothetical protein
MVLNRPVMISDPVMQKSANQRPFFGDKDEVCTVPVTVENRPPIAPATCLPSGSEEETIWHLRERVAGRERALRYLMYEDETKDVEQGQTRVERLWEQQSSER